MGATESNFLCGTIRLKASSKQSPSLSPLPVGHLDKCRKTYGWRNLGIAAFTVLLFSNRNGEGVGL